MSAQESRDGDVTVGEYAYDQPDGLFYSTFLISVLFDRISLHHVTCNSVIFLGLKRIVKYTAGPDGFKPTVRFV